jgi:hypothetical protein
MDRSEDRNISLAGAARGTPREAWPHRPAIKQVCRAPALLQAVKSM